MNGQSYYAAIRSLNWQKLTKNLLMAMTLILQFIHLGQQYLDITRHASADTHKSQQALVLIKHNYSLDYQLVITLGSQLRPSRRKTQRRPRSAKE